MAIETAKPDGVSTPGFQAVLPLWKLVLFGVAFVGPTAPFTFFGIGSVKSHGHLALVYLIALIAMSFTAASFGKMAAAFPEAGSTYSYASKALHPAVGHIAGWVMILDYLMLALIGLIIIGATLKQLVPSVPYAIWVLAVGGLATIINLFGIEMTSRATIVFNLILAVALMWFIGAALLAVARGTGVTALVSLAPFYMAPNFSLRAVMSTTPIAVLSFLGFDGISTLAEDSHNPRRNVALATVSVCFLCGSLFILQTYLGQLLWPNYHSFRSVETAFMDIGQRIGGAGLFELISFLVLAQAFVSAVTSQAATSRLLFGMARDGRMPSRIFGYLHPRRKTPLYSLGLLAVIQIIAALALDLDQSTQLVNFGACLGFMAVNASTIAWYFVRRGERGISAIWSTLIAPGLGFLICLWIWSSLGRLALEVGAVWTLGGLVHIVALRKCRVPT
jgi:putrescine importer